MGTFEEDNRIGAFSTENVATIWRMFEDGDITAETALRAIAIDAGVVARTSKQRALADLVWKVSTGELPPGVLIAAIDEED